jgi:hypothetical protein
MLYGFKLPQKKKIKCNKSHLSPDVRGSFKSKRQKKFKYKIRLNNFKLDLDDSSLKHKGTMPFSRHQKMAMERNSSLNFLFKKMTVPKTIKRRTEVIEKST